MIRVCDIEAEYCHFYEEQNINSCSSDRCWALGSIINSWNGVLPGIILSRCIMGKVHLPFYGYWTRAHSRMQRINHGFAYFLNEVIMNTRASTLKLGTDIYSNTYLIQNTHKSTLLSLPVKVYCHLIHHKYFKAVKLKSNV